MPPVELPDRLGIDVARRCLDEQAFLELRFENALEGDEEGGAIVAVPVGESSRRDLGVVDLYFTSSPAGIEAYNWSKSTLRNSSCPGLTYPLNFSFSAL